MWRFMLHLGPLASETDNLYFKDDKTQFLQLQTPFREYVKQNLVEPNPNWRYLYVVRSVVRYDQVVLPDEY